MPSLYLVDASPYVFRAYFSLPDTLRRPDGAPANATYGFTRFLLDLLARDDLGHAVLAFDRSLDQSFRNELYPAYKANRDPAPAELVQQFEDCRAVGRALGVVTLDSPLFEADDLLASVLHRHGAAVERSVVVTSDKDLAQLVREDVEWWDLAKDRRFDPDGVRAHFGVEPTQIVDLLALQGDAVDNIPGVPGVGAKTASALLRHFPDLESLLADLEGVAKLPIRGAVSVARKLEEHADLARLCRRLAELRRDAEVPDTLEALLWRGANAAELDAQFERLGFSRMRARVPAPKLRHGSAAESKA